MRHDALYLYGAACPEKDQAFGLILPIASTIAMQRFMDDFAESRPKDVHVVMIMDRAGWHCAKAMKIPENITPIFLPPYSPELNTIERLWLYMKERYLSHRLWPNYDDIVNAVEKAWAATRNQQGRITSLCNAPWLQSVKS